MDMLIIVLGLLMLLVLTLKKVPVSLAALISVVTIIIFSNMPVLGSLSDSYLEGFASFMKSSWLMILLGAVLSLSLIHI